MIDLQPKSGIEPLNARAIEILKLISEGLSNREISQRLHLSLDTVKWYNKQIFAKLGVNSRTQAVKVANQNDLLAANPASSTDTGPTTSNLPAQLTSFIGRKQEVGEIKSLLSTSRLLVLTGPGGTGKTRLAVQVAGQLIPAFRDGVWLVKLASLREPALLPNAISQTLYLNSLGDSSKLDFLKHYLMRKRMLLVMDNFEHILEGAPLLSELLAAAPQLSILATSRERLHIYGELEYPVNPLQLPNLEVQKTFEELLENESIDLFIQRARFARPRLQLGQDQILAIARICLRLDGLPLALELAASQVKIYPLPILAELLEESLGALPEGSRDLPERQRTLNGTIAWSEALLNPIERTLFVRLSVFNGGGGLEAIEAVCKGGLTTKMLPLLTTLVDKNLLIAREDQDGELRFTMLETIRSYARERLDSRNETNELSERHAAFYADLAEKAGKEFRTAKQVYWFGKLRTEHENLRAALSWSLSGENPILGMRIVAALSDHWFYNGFAVEGSRWTNLALERADLAPPGLQAAMLMTAGNLAYNLSDLRKGKDLLQRSRDLFVVAGDESGIAWATIYLSMMGLDYSKGIASSSQMILDSLATFRRLGEQPGVAQALNVLGELARAGGDYQAAQGYYEECLQLVKQTGEVLSEGTQYENLGFLALHRGQFELAERLIKQAMAIFRDMNTSYGMATCIASLAGPAVKLGFPRRAARLLGAANAELELLGTNQQPADQIEIMQYITDVRQALSPDEFQKSWDEGQTMCIRDAVNYGLGIAGEWGASG